MIGPPRYDFNGKYVANAEADLGAQGRRTFRNEYLGIYIRWEGESWIIFNQEPHRRIAAVQSNAQSPDLIRNQWRFNVNGSKWNDITIHVIRGKSDIMHLMKIAWPFGIGRQERHIVMRLEFGLRNVQARRSKIHQSSEAMSVRRACIF